MKDDNCENMYAYTYQLILIQILDKIFVIFVAHFDICKQKKYYQLCNYFNVKLTITRYQNLHELSKLLSVDFLFIFIFDS